MNRVIFAGLVAAFVGVSGLALLADCPDEKESSEACDAAANSDQYCVGDDSATCGADDYVVREENYFACDGAEEDKKCVDKKDAAGVLQEARCGGIFICQYSATAGCHKGTPTGHPCDGGPMRNCLGNKPLKTNTDCTAED